MCHSITAVLPSRIDIAHIKAIASRHGREFELLTNPSLTPQLRPGERYFSTNRFCDCGTSLGALPSYERREREN
ncbi:MAG: hypothetical protein WD065_05845 [Planctomycetaceae bacterium]